ncbi:MAG: site-specific DNA-methyltransferase [Desulfovibrionaceae bacterium]
MSIFHKTLQGVLIEGEALAVMCSMPSESFDLVLTDPPYSSGGMFRGDKAKATSDKYTLDRPSTIARPEFMGDNRDQRAFLMWGALWASEAHRLVKPGGVMCMFSDWRQLPVTTDIMQAGGFVWRGIAVWDKTEAARPQKGRFRSQCEYLVWGTKGAGPTDGACLPGVFRKAVRQDDKHHITGKPLHVVTEVARICPSGGRVLDPFAGSGTTAVACERLGLGWVCIEQVREYCEIARKRLLQPAAADMVAMMGEG